MSRPIRRRYIISLHPPAAFPMEEIDRALPFIVANVIAPGPNRDDIPGKGDRLAELIALAQVACGEPGDEINGLQGHFTTVDVASARRYFYGRPIIKEMVRASNTTRSLR